MVGMAVRKKVGRKEWLLLGIILGSFVPDMDNVAVAVATLMKAPTEGIHRMMTHIVFFMAAIVIVFYLIGRLKKEERWSNLGLGLGLGIMFHSLLDLLIWFNGVNLFWPLGGEVNFWANTTPPVWFLKFMDPAEFLFFGLYLWALGSWARKTSTDSSYIKTHRAWLILEAALFAIFTPLTYLMTKGFHTLFGAFYLFSLFMTFFVTIRMRKTVEAATG
jgi:uncharacterized membrane protein